MKLIFKYHLLVLVSLSFFSCKNEKRPCDDPDDTIKVSLNDTIKISLSITRIDSNYALTTKMTNYSRNKYFLTAIYSLQKLKVLNSSKNVELENVLSMNAPSRFPYDCDKKLWMNDIASRSQIDELQEDLDDWNFDLNKSNNFSIHYSDECYIIIDSVFCWNKYIDVKNARWDTIYFCYDSEINYNNNRLYRRGDSLFRIAKYHDEINGFLRYNKRIVSDTIMFVNPSLR